MQRKAIVTQGAVVINLRELGIDKLLGSGKVVRKLKVSVPLAVPLAKEKIEKAGGTVDGAIADREGVIAARKERAAEFAKKNAKTPPQLTAAKKKEE